MSYDFKFIQQQPVRVAEE